MVAVPPALRTGQIVLSPEEKRCVYKGKEVNKLEMSSIVPSDAGRDVLSAGAQLSPDL